MARLSVSAIIFGVTGQSAHPHRATRVDDLASTLLLHLAGSVLAAHQGCGEVSIDDGVKHRLLLLVNLLRLAACAASGHIAEKVQTAIGFHLPMRGGRP